MKVPSTADTIVRVNAYLSDEGFGYDNWHARQFGAPEPRYPAVLVLCATEADREEAQRRIAVALAEPSTETK